MTKTVALIQSCYLPWKGYFDIINSVDEFIFYDDVQFTKNDWRNRNIIKTAQGPQWLTIPVHGGLGKLIKDIKVASTNWPDKHWKTLEQNYNRARFFSDYKIFFENIYRLCRSKNYLSEINYQFISQICNILNISTILSWSTDYNNHLIGITNKTERIVALCKATNATSYISGPAAKNYLNEALFTEADITIKYVDYSNYPTYKQLYGEFVHTVSILDLIFNKGPCSIQYMKSFSKL